ncbi:MAG TPA: hypothetical protein VIY52_05295 [Streptosporangiaceae bacterium]
MTGRGARWSVSRWISSTVGGPSPRLPAKGRVSRQRCPRMGKKITGNPSGRKNACVESSRRSQSISTSASSQS